MVIIYQSGTVDLVYNKSGGTGCRASNHILELSGNMRGQV